jgi:uncharacterized protein YndB with AHSA1/START domain
MTTTTSRPQLVIKRELKAPQELVFKAFTESKHLVHWWGPKGFQLEVNHLDVRPGGKFHYSMKMNENVMHGLFQYKEVSPFGKIVFISSFADEQGNIIKAPFGIDFPLEVMNTWTFEEKDGITTITIQGGPYNATEEQNKVYESMFASMNQGFGGTFDQLEAYLVTMNSY